MSNKVLTAGVATLSWIDPKTGLPEVDKRGDPGREITREDIKAGKLYRFANFLEATVTFDSNGGILKAEFTSDSNMYRGPSAFGLDSAPVGKIGRSITQAKSSVTFRQIVGSRTESPEKVGEAGGFVAGVATGVAVGWAFGPVGMFVGAVAIGAVGYFTGREVAELASAFPPIWTELELTINLDSTLSHSLISHSVFPSNTLYAEGRARASARDSEVYLKQNSSYDGDNVRLPQWKKNGWDNTPRLRKGATDGNPWGMSDPGKVIGQGVLQQDCPAGYKCK